MFLGENTFIYDKMKRICSLNRICEWVCFAMPNSSPFKIVWVYINLRRTKNRTRNYMNTSTFTRHMYYILQLINAIHRIFCGYFELWWRYFCSQVKVGLLELLFFCRYRYIKSPELQIGFMLHTVCNMKPICNSGNSV